MTRFFLFDAVKGIVAVAAVSASVLIVNGDAVAGTQELKLSDNILESVFASLPNETTDSQSLANAEFERQIDGRISDKNLASEIVDVVTKTIDDGLKKGEEWIKNGGIRDAVQKGLDKTLDGKVSDADKQRIQSMADALCNVNSDGGTSFVKALGSDGKDLAASLAVNELKKQISQSLPKDVADSVNTMLDSLAATRDITDPTTRGTLVDAVQAAVKTYVPYGNSADAINRLVADIADGNGVDVIGAAKDLGKSIAADGLKEVVSKNLDKNAAEKINALIDAYTQNGTQGLTDAALAEINAAIDKYAPGADSAAALKDVVSKMANGTAKPEDLRGVGTSVVADAAKNLIDKSGLSAEAKQAAKEAVDQLAKNGLSGLTGTAQAYIQQYVTGKLGENAGNAAGAIFGSIVTPGADVWDALEKNAPIIGQAVLDKCLQKAETWAAGELDKLIAKCPALKNVLDNLGINGASIVGGLKNIWNVISGKDLAEALTALSQLAVDWFKDLAAKLIDWGVKELIGLANSVIAEVLDWVSDLLGKIAEDVNWSVLKDALLKLQSQLDAVRTNGAIKISVSGVGSNVVNWIESKMKKGGGQKKAAGSFK